MIETMKSRAKQKEKEKFVEREGGGGKRLTEGAKRKGNEGTKLRSIYSVRIPC